MLFPGDVVNHGHSLGTVSNHVDCVELVPIRCIIESFVAEPVFLTRKNLQVRIGCEGVQIYVLIVKIKKLFSTCCLAKLFRNVITITIWSRQLLARKFW